MPRFTVCIDWTDTSSPTCSDVDEIVVCAEDSDAAVKKAISRWGATIGAKYPSCRVDGAFVLTRAIRENPDARPV